jgi:hypothetical protein
MTIEELKSAINLTVDVAMWRQKAADLQSERDYLRERVVALERLLGDRLEKGKAAA